MVEPPTSGDSRDKLNLSLRSEAHMVVPPPEAIYQITEDRLTLICKRGKDQSLEYSLCFIGAGFGLFQNVIYIFRDIINLKVPGAVDLILALLCVTSLAYGFARLREYLNTKTNIDELAKKIRTGTKVPLQ